MIQHNGTLHFSCRPIRKRFLLVLFRYQCYLGPTSLLKNVAFVCTTIILYSRPNWYALVKSCISVNHYVLLVRRHVKYLCGLWSLRNFEERWKMAPPLGYPKTKKLSASGPLPPDARAFPQLQICRYTTVCFQALSIMELELNLIWVWSA